LSDGQYRSERISGTPLLGSTRGGPTTFVEGTGRFVGEPATGAIRASGEAAGDGVTLNLVNVPAPQAAKIVLGDMLSVKYTVDPGIEGKITIQTPKPVTRTAAIDLFQAALRSNNDALVDTDGTYRIVPIDQANIGAGIRVEGEPQGDHLDFDSATLHPASHIKLQRTDDHDHQARPVPRSSDLYLSWS
jgi:general secretion pathway protein D